MPNCSETHSKCGVACTEDGLNRAYYKDCKTGRVGTGKTYTEAIQSATKSLPKCAGLKGATLEACKNGIKPTVMRIDPAKFINAQGKPVKQIKKEGITPSRRGITPAKLGPKSVPAGSRFDSKTNNWKDTEILLGDTKPDNDPSTVNRPEDGDSGNCYGIPMECGSLAIIGGAVVLLIVVLTKIF